jgi:MarR family
LWRRVRTRGDDRLLQVNLRRERAQTCRLARSAGWLHSTFGGRLDGDRSRGVANLICLRPDEVTFWPEDFVVFFTLAAVEVGIDVQSYGARLNPKAARPEFIPGAALRTVAEVAGVYEENPGALTLFKVQRAFLVTMTAALIGIATGKVVDDPTLSGALGGVGGLLMNILAQRYLEDGAEPETDWLEEFILATLQRHGPQSIAELHKLTHVHRPLLTRTLRGLIRKKLVARAYRWDGGRTVIYGLPRRDI